MEYYVIFTEYFGDFTRGHVDQMNAIPRFLKCYRELWDFKTFLAGKTEET
jgi:hypothetical protein